MPYKRSKTSPQVSKYCQSDYYFCAISRFSSIFSHVHHFYFLFLQLLKLFCFFQCFGPCLCFLCVDFLLLQHNLPYQPTKRNRHSKSADRSDWVVVKEN